MAAAKRNGGQEFGEVKANVQSLVKVLDDFRAETRDMRKELLAELKDVKTEMNAKFTKHEEELGALKRWRWYTNGIAVGVGAAGSWIVKHLA